MRDSAPGGSCGEENENRVCNFQFDTSIEMRSFTERSVNYTASGYDMKWNGETWNWN